MNAILEAGLRVPDDIAVIGCGNLHYDNSLRVPLSSVDQHSHMIGERAGKILLNILESKTRPQPISVILDPALIVRSSTLRNQPALRSVAHSVKKTDKSSSVSAKTKSGNRARLG